MRDVLMGKPECRLPRTDSLSRGPGGPSQVSDSEGVVAGTPCRVTHPCDVGSMLAR